MPSVKEQFDFGARFEGMKRDASSPFFERAGQTRFTRGQFTSPNYKKGEAGWMIDEYGNAEFNDGVFRGAFNIGGTNITIDNTEDIQENLDAIESEGGGTLFLQPGTYTLTADISIPSGVQLEGISRDGVIIDCNSSFKINMSGTDVYITGTVAISNGDTTVVGTGTTFTSGMVGRYIFLDGIWYEILTFTDTTHIEIDTYTGINLSGYAVAIANPNFNSFLREVTVQGATGVGVSIQYASEPNLNDIVVTACGTGIDMDYVVFPRTIQICNGNGVNLNMNFVEGFYIDWSEFSFSTTGAGVVMSNCKVATFFNSLVNNNTGDGINMTNCSSIAFMSYEFKNNGGQGLEMVSGCNDNQIGLGTVVNNTSDGIKLTATSDRNTIVATSVKDSGGYGINIAASTCDNNQIIAPAFDNNTSGNINDDGTNTFVSPQTLSADVQTFNYTGSAQTWTKPSSGSIVLVQLWGGGASGGRGTTNEGAGGGGGGGYIEAYFAIGALGSTETVTIGAGGAARTTEGVGNIGGDTTFGSLLTAYGGAGGANNAGGGGGGGGGGSIAAGSPGSGTSGGAGGGIAGGSGGAPGGSSVYGGAGGGNGAGTGSVGGSSTFGGGGGGGGEGGTGTGGVSYYAGGGGGGANTTGSGAAGGNSVLGGDGGAGSADANAATAGSTPAGGGGGSELGDSGAGGNGRCIVTTF